jgi:hypothetical protein
VSCGMLCRVALVRTSPLGPQRFESPYVSMSSLPIEEQYVRFEIFTGKPHGVTSQKIQFFIVTAAETSNLTL